jgi:hypothetical protein
MMAGALALCLYAFAVIRLLMKWKLRTLTATTCAIPVWLGCAIAHGFCSRDRSRMAIRINLRVLRKTKWNEYALRFLFRGTITVATSVRQHQMARRERDLRGSSITLFEAAKRTWTKASELVLLSLPDSSRPGGTPRPSYNHPALNFATLGRFRRPAPRLSG